MSDYPQPRFTPVPQGGVIGVKTGPLATTPLPLHFPLAPTTYPGYYEVPFNYGQVYTYPVMTRDGGGWNNAADSRFLPLPIPLPPRPYPPYPYLYPRPYPYPPFYGPGPFFW
ncbi:MAG TPA: hypothetical protein VFV52_02125 [Bacilli bacterium]|nr:hypothetical protein [Bacilli bacterium]